MRWIDITKVVDVTGLQNGIENTLKSLKNKQTEITEVETAVQGIIALEDAFKGKSGDAVRDYYKEAHLPFISYYKAFIEDYESKLKIMDNELHALESASNGRIVESFLTGELKSSLQNTANHTITLTDEANKTILSVQDIVAAPQLSDTSFLEEVDDAKKQINDTVEKMHQFDYNQSNALEQLSNDVSNMQNYIDGIKSHFKSGKLQLENYTSGTLNKYQLDDLLLKAGSTCSREDTEDTEEIEELKKKLLNASTIDEYLKIAEEIGDANLDEDQKQIVTIFKTAKGIKDGLYKAGKDFVIGIRDAVLHPVKTVESTIQAIAHPIETYDYISKAISDSFVRDVINGDAESRARWISYATGTVVTSVVGTKGVGAVSKAGMATTKVATKAAAKAGVSTVKGALKETSIPNLFPYAPQHQLAGVNVGGVPYNTVNSAGLRDRLLSMAKVESKGSGKGTKGTGEGSKKASEAGESISKADYKGLRKKTPSKEIRKSVNPDGPKIDPVYGYEVNKFEADHIVSMKEITEMDGFNRLTKEKQIEVLNLKENFIGLGKSTNASKGVHSWADWKGHSKMGEVPVNVRIQMLELEEQARDALKVAIEERLK